MKRLNLNFGTALESKSHDRDLKVEFPAGLSELTTEETKTIVGGESLAYWIGYAAGKIARFFS